MHRIVFLDRATIAPQIRLRSPDFPHSCVEHQHTLPEQAAERLVSASIAIINKVPLDAATLASLRGSAVSVRRSGRRHDRQRTLGACPALPCRSAAAQRAGRRQGEQGRRAGGALPELQDSAGIRQQRKAHPPRAGLGVGAYRPGAVQAGRIATCGERQGLLALHDIAHSRGQRQRDSAQISDRLRRDGRVRGIYRRVRFAGTIISWGGEMRRPSCDGTSGCPRQIRSSRASPSTKTAGM